MTEFLIFLLLCGAFALVFRTFLRMPTREHRFKAQVEKEHSELRARVLAEDLARQASEGREAGVRRFVPSAGQYPLEQYDGEPPERPFGRDLGEPGSREVPEPFRGGWSWEQADTDDVAHRLSLRATELIHMQAIGPEPVVAVYPIDASRVAIVTQQMEDGRWRYAEHLFQLLEGGAVITDLESMDMRWRRVR